MPDSSIRNARTELHEAAGSARRAGDLPGARALLLHEASWSDPHRVMLLVLTLNDLEDSEGLQQALGRAIAALPTIEHVSNEYLMFLHRRAEQYCLDDRTRAPMLAMMSARVETRQAPPDAPLARVWEAGRQRRDFGARFMARGSPASFVPLGLNCMPWVLVNRWGMQSAEAYRRNLTPFAMAVHTIPGVVGALQTDFESYTAPDQVMTIKAPGGRPVVMRKDRGATWVHHDNPYFFTDDYANLRAGMADRAAAMRTACAAPAPVFMMNFVNVDYPRQKLAFLPNLRRALAAFTGRADHFIFMSNTIAAHEGPSVYDVDAQTCFFFCAPPEKGFQWNTETNLDTQKSMEFERRYISRIEECLGGWGL